jgi:hypothetical protein
MAAAASFTTRCGDTVVKPAGIGLTPAFFAGALAALRVRAAALFGAAFRADRLIVFFADFLAAFLARAAICAS